VEEEVLENEELGAIKIYNDLVDKLDTYEESLVKKYRDSIKCGKGCTDCCTLKEIYPIEAYSILAPIMEGKIDTSELPDVSDREEGKCVFLKNRECSIYSARPIQCRVVGYPGKLKNEVSYCEKNFEEKPDFADEDLIDTENLNASVESINTLFIEETEEGVFGNGNVSMENLLEAIKNLP